MTENHQCPRGAELLVDFRRGLRRMMNGESWVMSFPGNAPIQSKAQERVTSTKSFALPVSVAAVSAARSTASSSRHRHQENLQDTRGTSPPLALHHQLLQSLLHPLSPETFTACATSIWASPKPERGRLH